MKIFQFLIIFSGVLSGIILMFFGFKKTGFKKKKGNILLTTLLSTLQLIYINYSCSRINNNQTQRIGIENIAEQNYRFYRIKETYQWKRLKQLWKEIDILYIIDSSEDEISFNMNRFIDYEKAEELRFELDTIMTSFYSLKDSLSINDFEIQIIKCIFKERIDNMTGIRYLTRMALPPVDIDKSSIIDSVESKIDILNKFVDKNIISPEEYDSGITNIINNIISISTLDILNNVRIYDYYYEHTDSFSSILHFHTWRFERSYDEFAEKLKKGDIDSLSFSTFSDNYYKTKEELLRLDSIVPFLDTIFTNLLLDD